MDIKPKPNPPPKEKPSIALLRNPLRILVLVTSLVGGVTFALGAGATPTPIVVEDNAAVGHLGETVTVEGTVSRCLPAPKGTHFSTLEQLTRTKHLPAGYRRRPS
jgi:hypothetical protein